MKGVNGQAAIARTPASARTLHGQAAIEYLMTYGWALLVLGIVIVLIYSTGVFSSTYLISEECNLGPRLPCQAQVYAENGGGVVLRVENGFGYPVRITGVAMELDGAGTANVGEVKPDMLKSGETSVVNAAVTAPLDKDSVQIVRVALKYYSCAPEVNRECDTQNSNEHTISGRIVGKVG